MLPLRRVSRNFSAQCMASAKTPRFLDDSIRGVIGGGNPLDLHSTGVGMSGIVYPPILAESAGVLDEFIKPCIAFSLYRAEGSVPVGVSKFGGMPDVGDTFVWPMDEQLALGFLLQVNLSDVKPFVADGELPTSGLLSFFYDPEAQAWGFDPKDICRSRVIFEPGALHPHRQMTPGPPPSSFLCVFAKD